MALGRVGGIKNGRGAGGGGSTGNPGGKVPNFSASAKLSKQKIKVLGISR